MEIPDPSSTAAAIGAELGDIESQLIQLTREGSRGGTRAGERSLDEVISELAALPQRIHPHYSRLVEILERRDLTYELVATIEELRKRALWLYRRSRLERIFYAKLRLERSLRDTLYRQILEAYDEFSSMEAMESHLRGFSDDVLAAELLREDVAALGE